MTPPLLALFSLGTFEIVVIAVLILIFFGSKRIPALGRSLGRTAGELKQLFKSKDPGPKE